MNTPIHRPQRLAALGAAAAVAALLTGCAAHSSGQRAPAQQRQLQICNAQPVQAYIGHNSAASTIEMVRKGSGSYMVRVLREGQPATMDHNPERLNVLTNAEGRITSLHCG